MTDALVKPYNPFGKNTKIVRTKTLLLYQEFVGKDAKWKRRLFEAFRVPTELNPGPVTSEVLPPYVMFRDASFAYHNEKLAIRVEKDDQGKDMFLLVFYKRIIGYFEPTN